MADVRTVTGGDFALLLNDIEIESDGIPHDPGIWDAWMDAVNQVAGLGSTETD